MKSRLLTIVLKLKYHAHTKHIALIYVWSRHHKRRMSID